MVAKENRCPHCGDKLPPDALNGICPKCLMKAGLASEINVTLESLPTIEGPGTKIGRYKLLELIGEGGMGLVYLAEQSEPVKRRVALKVLKPGMDSKEVIARFESERQALALLDHPNIAHVFDAGTTATGRPYFVMEYVKGMSITRYCDEHRLNIEQRLKLFRDVCEGVHHAHQKGIIHRDIKPSNILVSLHGDRAVPKIIDFGIAKAAVSTLTEKTIFTFHGQLLGTPEYMSPEQVDLATHDIDTRSDIYSLGVVLYELLSGVLPFEIESLQKIGLAELQHTIRELEPASPSIRLSNLGQKAKAIADNRMTQVVPLARRLHRELEWIPLKAMRKDRCRRYKSASDMADDIQNYLNGNPLIAGPETVAYRVKKFVHKHAGSVATAAIIAIAIILGLVISTAMYLRSEKALQKEAVARIRAEKAEVTAQEQRELAEERADAYRRAVYGNTLALAQGAIDDAKFNRAQELLNSCESEFRGWEWYRLNYLSTDQSVRTFLGHSGNITSAALSPDGTRIASVSPSERFVKIWDTATGAEVMTLSHNDYVFTVAFSPNGRHIALGSEFGTIQIWDTTTSTNVMTIKGHENYIWALAFSPDGKRIVSGGNDRIIKVWDVDTGAELMKLKGHERTVGSAVFSPDGNRIVSGSGDGTIRLWDVNTGAEEMTIRGHTGGVGSVIFSSDGSQIVSSGGDKIVRVWDAITGDEIKAFMGHSSGIISVAISPDAKLIASAGFDKTIKIWDAESGNELSTLRGHTDDISSVVFSPESDRVFSASLDGMIKEWDPTVDRDVLSLYGDIANSHTSQAAFSPDGKHIAAAREGKIKLWDAVSGAEIMTILGGGINSIAFSPDGRWIASGSAGNTVKVWNAMTSAMERTLIGHTEGVMSVAFSPDGRRIVSGSGDKTIRIWNATTGAMEMALAGHREGVRSVTFSPDGGRIISAGDDGTVRIWDVLSGAQLKVLNGHEGAVYSVSASSDGTRIASCGEDKTIKIWDAATGAELMTLHGHESLVSTVAFSPDSRRIVSGDHNRVTKIWDADTGTELMILDGDPYWTNRKYVWIGSAVFSPDGKSICVCYESGDVTIWESVDPVAGYGPRRTVKRATAMVDALYDQYRLYGDVISQLTERNIDEAVREVALQIANARLYIDTSNLGMQSLQLLRSPDANESTYREALEMAEKAVQLNPDNLGSLSRLANAQYRVGAYEETIVTCEKIREKKNENIRPNPFIQSDGLRAMALHQLGRDKEAKDSITQERDILIRWISQDDFGFVLHINRVFEFEKLFADGDDRLLSSLELIEKDKLDEAAEIIEKIRLSNDVEAIGRAEGAVKLLSILYYRRGRDNWLANGNYPEMIADYEKAISFDPDNAKALMQLAWTYATCPEADLRDGEKAVEMATRACELTDWKDYEAISTVAAACFQIGDFNNAVKWQQEAINLIPVERRVELETEYQERLSLYESGKPYHESP